MRCSCWRDWLVATRCSPRSSIHETARPVRQRSERDEHVFRVQLTADTERAADVALAKDDHVPRQAEHDGERVAVVVRHLGRALEDEHARGLVDARPGPAGLERHPGVATDGELQLDDGVRAGEGDVDLAVILGQRDDFAGVAVVVPLERRRTGIQVDRQLLQLDRHCLARVLDEVWIGGEHRGDGFTHVPDPVPRQHRLEVRAPSRGDPTMRIAMFGSDGGRSSAVEHQRHTRRVMERVDDRRDAVGRGPPPSGPPACGGRRAGSGRRR